MQRIRLTCVLLSLAAALHAEPAGFYQWQSRLTGQRICAQVSPGSGWQRLSGPYEDAGCRQRKANF